MENECKEYLSKGPLNFIIVVWSDRGGPGPPGPPLNPRLYGLDDILKGKKELNIKTGVYESRMKVNGNRLLRRPKRLWSSSIYRRGAGGSLCACHAADLGKIPGQEKFPGWGFSEFFLTCKTNVRSFRPIREHRLNNIGMETIILD